jgi:hypothetical protein
MATITGTFDDGGTARAAVGRLRDAGFDEGGITFVTTTPDEGGASRGVDDAADAGRRLGSLAADVGQTVAAFLPVVGSTVVRSPLARALRAATEAGGESAGRIVGAVSEGGFGTGGEGPRDGQRRPTVVVSAPDGRDSEAAALLYDAGAVEVCGS